MNKTDHARAIALRTLKRLMREHGLTCREVAEMTHFKEQTVRAWRSGRNPVSATALALLQHELK
jgi:DNA-binding transcriptional regulator YiaG